MIYLLRKGCGCNHSSAIYKSEKAALAALAKCPKRDPYWSMLLCNVREDETRKGRFCADAYHCDGTYDVMLSEVENLGRYEKAIGHEMGPLQRRYCVASIFRGVKDGQIIASLKDGSWWRE